MLYNVWIKTNPLCENIRNFKSLMQLNNRRKSTPQQIWMRTIRKYRRVQHQAQKTSTKKQRQKLKSLAKRLLRLNQRWQIGIASLILIN